MTTKAARMATPMKTPIAIPIFTAAENFSSESGSFVLYALVDPGTMLGGFVRSGRATWDWSVAVRDGAKAFVIVVVGCSSRPSLVSV